MAQLLRRLSKQDSVSVSQRRKSSALDDPEWKSILEIKNEALKVWRLPDKGPAIPLLEEQYGFFLSDERYVVLKVSNHNRKLCYDLHFWIGLNKASKLVSEPPEKVSQVMALLNDNIVVHREIGEFESPLFKSYFKEFGILNGSLSDLFDPENPEKYVKRLLRFKLTRNKSRIEVTEVPISRLSLDSNDVFIFDEGTKMTQWNGKRCDEEERISAKHYIERSLKARKTKCTSEFVDEEDLFDYNELYRKLGDAPVPARPMRLMKNAFKKSMHRLTDETKKLVLHNVYNEKVYRSGINVNDVSFIDTLHVLYVYIGPGSSDNEKANVWPQADKYLKDKKSPYKSITVFNAGTYCEGFEEIWDDARQ
ncbi:unnamed protein product [Rodentolepis nana]|uniref:Gelsolin-like domain-containing protein n=1 Tax=Rodentolepis nana TaxID=102285 RepID=A0A0R3T1L8_RODNA|nr:unnamed protein product [Rodentolepis nana]